MHLLRARVQEDHGVHSQVAHVLRARGHGHARHAPRRRLLDGCRWVDVVTRRAHAASNVTFSSTNHLRLQVNYNQANGNLIFGIIDKNVPQDLQYLVKVDKYVLCVLT